MNKVVHHEGWLTKSPPSKPFFKARWRRRWFTLKQGEIPTQFFLEYYTDKNCRKLKGVIDLDHCEQVDVGLHFEHRKYKYHHMYSITTPKRTYYLAADTDEDMRGWVNCICQVCNLQDCSKSSDNGGFENNKTYSDDCKLSATTDNKSANDDIHNTRHQTPHDDVQQNNDLAIGNSNKTYQNDDFALRGSSYTNRDTMVCDTDLNAARNRYPSGFKEQLTSAKEDYYNVATADGEAKIGRRSRVFKRESNTDSMTSLPQVAAAAAVVVASKPLVDGAVAVGAIKKIPENLKLGEGVYNGGNDDPSPALSTCSGPYIPISDCFSGSPIHLNDSDNPATPLNFLDPKFYDTPRSHTIVDYLNLTGDQPYSPKRNNLVQASNDRPRSRSSSTDSESVFTDDESCAQPTKPPPKLPLERRPRPSDSSIENDSFTTVTYAQRFSKVPEDGKPKSDDIAGPHALTSAPPPRPPKRLAGIQIHDDDKKEIQSSDTENASPAIGPKDISCFVEESYDIPRSHQPPYFNFNTLSCSEKKPPSPSENGHNDATHHGAPRPHCYTNAAPTKIEGNIFRYDFIEQADAPAVNRSLKPKSKLNGNNDKNEESIPEPPIKTASVSIAPVKVVPPPATPTIVGTVKLEPLRPPPCVDRTAKPRFDSSSLRRRGGGAPISMVISPSAHDSSSELSDQPFYDNCSKTLPRRGSSSSTHSTHTINNNNNGCNINNNNSVAMLSPPPTSVALSPCPFKNNDKLQYFDLDQSSRPSISTSTSNLSPAPTLKLSVKMAHHNAHGASGSTYGTAMKVANTAVRPPIQTGIVYNTVDFLKTEAFMRTRHDAEMNRAKKGLNE